MHINTQANAHYYLISLNGELDASSALHLDTTLQQAVDEGHQQLLVDCSALDYIASAGIGVFTSRVGKSDGEGAAVVLFGMSDKVYNVFKILGLHQLLPIYDTLEEAKAHLNG